MTARPDPLTEAHQEIYRLVELLHRQRQKLARLTRSKELLARVPVDLAQRLGPEVIVAMAEREGEKAAREEAARQQRDLPQLLEEFIRRAEAKHRQAAGDESSAER
jgi:hypothetical protein